MSAKASKILVIEDHADVLDGVMRILEYGGYEAEGTTRFSDDVFEKLKKEHFNLIILDVMLSGKDGRDIVRQFKSDKETKDIPILMMSAYPNIGPSVKKAGAEYFIKKPFGVKEMISKLESISKGEK